MNPLSPQQQSMIQVFEKHMKAELDGDLATTMATMTANPHLNHVPVMAGGNGPDGVHAFYRDHLVGKFFPKDTTFTSVSRTIGQNTLVEEMIIAFTHTTKLDFMLPGVEPTGKRIESAFVVIIGFEGGRISHEHIYWDQASVLVQIGLLDPNGLPVRGANSARSVLDPSLLAHKK